MQKLLPEPQRAPSPNPHSGWVDGITVKASPNPHSGWLDGITVKPSPNLDGKTVKVFNLFGEFIYVYAFLLWPA